jgi:hypothetical protein
VSDIYPLRSCRFSSCSDVTALLSFTASALSVMVTPTRDYSTILWGMQRWFVAVKPVRRQSTRLALNLQILRGRSSPAFARPAIRCYNSRRRAGLSLTPRYALESASLLKLPHTGGLPH